MGHPHPGVAFFASGGSIGGKLKNGGLRCVVVML